MVQEKNTVKTAYTTAFYETSWVVITDWRIAHKLGEIPAATVSDSDLHKRQGLMKYRCSAVHIDAKNSET